jgi:hypothetical protein
MTNLKKAALAAADRALTVCVWLIAMPFGIIAVVLGRLAYPRRVESARNVEPLTKRIARFDAPVRKA